MVKIKQTNKWDVPQENWSTWFLLKMKMKSRATNRFKRGRNRLWDAFHWSKWDLLLKNEKRAQIDLSVAEIVFVLLSIFHKIAHLKLRHVSNVNHKYNFKTVILIVIISVSQNCFLLNNFELPISRYFSVKSGQFHSQFSLAPIWRLNAVVICWCLIASFG